MQFLGSSGDEKPGLFKTEISLKHYLQTMGSEPVCELVDYNCCQNEFQF